MRARDVVAGLSVAGLMLPEAVAYAGIAGLPPSRAIAAAVVGAAIYGLVGRSRFAVVSPTSSSAAILAATLATFPGDAAMRAGLATLAVAVAGCLFLIAWIARLGLVTGFIARPVLRGFAFGLAITIILHQIPAITGVVVPPGDLAHVLVATARSLPDAHGGSVAVGLVALVALVLLRRLPMLPGAFLVVVAGSGLSILFDLPAHGIATVGTIDFAFTWPRLPDPASVDLPRLVQLTLPLVLILFAESWGTMRTLALRHGDEIAPDRELGALGLANLAAAAAQGMPVGAGFSAGSASEAAGTTSRASALVAAAGLAVLMAVAGPLVARLPEPVLAAVVISALAHALDPAPLVRLWKIDRDAWIAIAAAIGVLALGIVDGMLAAVALSLAALLRRLAAPQVARLGRLPGTRDYVDVARHADAIMPPSVGIWRPSEPLFFANAERVLGAVARTATADASIRIVVLSLEESFDLDSTALEALMEFDTRLAAAGRPLFLGRARDPLRDLLKAAGADDLARRSGYSVEDAVGLAVTAAAAGAEATGAKRAARAPRG